MINDHNYSSNFKEKILIKEKRTVHIRKIRKIRKIRSVRQNNISQNNNGKTRLLHILKILCSHIGEILTLSGVFCPDIGDGTNKVIRIVCFLVLIIVEIIFSLTQESK